MKEWLGGKWVHEARLRLSGDIDAAKRLIGYGRSLVGYLRDQVGHGAPPVQVLRKKLVDGSEVAVRLINGQAVIEVFAPVKGAKAWICSVLVRLVKHFYVRALDGQFNEVQVADGGGVDTKIDCQNMGYTSYEKYGVLDWNNTLSVDYFYLLYTPPNTVVEGSITRYGFLTKSRVGHYLYYKGRAVAKTAKDICGFSIAFDQLILVTATNTHIYVYAAPFSLLTDAFKNKSVLMLDANLVSIAVPFPNTNAYSFACFSKSGTMGIARVHYNPDTAISFSVISATNATISSYVDPKVGIVGDYTTICLGYDYADDTLVGMYRRIKAHAASPLPPPTMCSGSPFEVAGEVNYSYSSTADGEYTLDFFGFHSSFSTSISGWGSACYYDGYIDLENEAYSSTSSGVSREVGVFDLRYGAFFESRANISSTNSRERTGSCCSSYSIGVPTGTSTVTDGELIFHVGNTSHVLSSNHNGYQYPTHVFGSLRRCSDNSVIGVVWVRWQLAYTSYKSAVLLVCRNAIIDITDMLPPASWSPADVGLTGVNVSTLPPFLKAGGIVSSEKINGDL